MIPEMFLASLVGFVVVGFVGDGQTISCCVFFGGVGGGGDGGIRRELWLGKSSCL